MLQVEIPDDLVDAIDARVLSERRASRAGGSTAALGETSRRRAVLEAHRRAVAEWKGWRMTAEQVAHGNRLLSSKGEKAFREYVASIKPPEPAPPAEAEDRALSRLPQISRRSVVADLVRAALRAEGLDVAPRQKKSAA